jgi:argininosuccinate synthase
MAQMTDNPLTAPDQPEEITIEFEKGIPISLKTANSTVTGSVYLFDTLNKIGKKHGIGRQDIVENRYIGEHRI